jgi:hypothetical protein
MQVSCLDSTLKMEAVRSVVTPANFYQMSTRRYIPEDRWPTLHTTSVTKIKWLLVFREIIAACSENHTKHINTMCM